MESLPTITRDSSVRFPSTWRTAIGKPLSSRRIHYYALLGRYGSAMQAAAQRHEAGKRNPHVQGLDNPLCVQCGQKHTLFRRRIANDWLDKTGLWCPLCIAVARSDRDKEREQRKEWRNRLVTEYV